MQCQSCGAELVPGDVFCGACGAAVPAVSAPPPASQVPRSDQVSPTQQMAPPPPPPLPIAAANAAAAGAPPPPPFPGAAGPAGAAPPPFPEQPATEAAKTGLSTGAIIGIVGGSLAFVLVLAAVGFFTYRAFVPKVAVVKVTSTSATKPATTPVPSTTATQPAETPAAESPAAATAPANDEIVTDAEARDVVKKFLDARIAKDIAGSKVYCSQKMLTGDNGSFVNDKYWAPDSYKIIKTTPDLMFIHVTTMGVWPSGDELTIYSVWRDPDSGKVVIDGMLDAEQFPEMLKP